MRSRSAIKEQSCESICAFCTHRLGKTRRHSHVQRRFLQSSRPAWNPPAAGAAMREEEDSIPTPPPKKPLPTWGSFGGAASWGKPSSGNAKHKPILQTAVPGMTGGFRQTSTPLQLMPQEQRARDLVVEQQRRKVLIRSGPGPETTRAGRAEPDVHRESMRYAKPETKVAWARNVAAMREEKEAQKQRELEMRAADNAPSFRIRTLYTSKGPSHALGDPTRSFVGHLQPRDQDEAPWSQLKKRHDEPRAAAPDHPKPKPVDGFMEGRKQREAQFLAGHQQAGAAQRSVAYVPLGGMRRQDTTDSPLRTVEPRRTEEGVPLGGSRLVELQQTADRPIQIPELRRGAQSLSVSMKRVNLEPIDQRQGEHTSRDPKSLTSFRIIQVEAPEEGEGEEESGGRKKKKERRKRGSESDWAERVEVEAQPKGKAKDKAKRREQFVEDPEEAEEARIEARARAEAKKQRRLEKEAKKAAAPIPILLPEYITVANLATALRVKLEAFVEKMVELGYEETGSDYILNAENAGLIAMEYNYEALVDRSESEDLKGREPAEDPSILPQRPPVVTIMGHVDHGKTTLLDYLRKSSVAATEHGGITQHIGAFSVPMPSGKLITFLDTPGHAAFLNMRQRGANVTDIVILVVAADDSVKPQTIEAINHAKAAKVPIIVAINKIDKEDTDVDRVKQDLARHGVDVEDFGGDTQAICVSGKTGQGMKELEESVVALSEIIDMRAETDGQAEGWVLEASIKSMGKVATVLVRRGTLRLGDFIVAGKTWARVRCLRNEAGFDIEFAGPGTPVEIDGWREQPLAGDEVLQAPDEARAKSIVDYRLDREERDKMAEDMEVINEIRKAEHEKREQEKEAARLAKEAEESGTEVVPEEREEKASGPKKVYFIVKGDVSGSVEAVIDSISMLGNAEVSAHVLRSGVGQISEFDIEHAAAAKGLLINFNTAVEPSMIRLAEINKVKIIDHNIIYRLVDDVKVEMSKHLKPLVTHKVLGEAEVSQIFSITIKNRKQQAIAGCKVRNGTIARNARVRVHRRDDKVFDGALASLKQVKKDVQEMKKGSECGIGFDGWYDFEVGDLIQSYEAKEEKRYL